MGIMPNIVTFNYDKLLLSSIHWSVIGIYDEKFYDMMALDDISQLKLPSLKGI